MNRLEEKLVKIPEKAGIYQFMSQSGLVIYIGKSVNLKRRVAQYFSYSHSKWEAHTARLVRNINDIKWIVTNSELLALLLEDKLVKKHWPMYNVKQKEFLKYKYICITREEYPRLLILGHEDTQDSQDIFGPFPDKYYLSTFLNIVYDYFAFDLCRDQSLQMSCMNKSVVKCIEQCRKNRPVEEYRNKIETLRSFLKGNEKAVTAGLHKQIDYYSQSLEFEKADKVKNNLKTVYIFCKRQQFLGHFKNSQIIIRENGKYTNTFLFVRGKLVGYWNEMISDNELLQFSEFYQNQKEVDQDPVWILNDRAYVVYSWMNRTKKENFELIFK